MKRKVHKADVYSDPYDMSVLGSLEFENLCGIISTNDSIQSQNWSNVTCKKCLKYKNPRPKFKKYKFNKRAAKEFYSRIKNERS